MANTEQFQRLADAACARVDSVGADQVDALLADGVIALDVRNNEDHQAGHIAGSLNISWGVLEMAVEGQFPDLDTALLCYCNGVNRGALSADTLRSLGYVNAKYIDGGLVAYQALASKAL
jgi:rhodanese-related sulfurtransferase